MTTLNEHNLKQLAHTPMAGPWPATLPLELALKTGTPQELKEYYQIDDASWMALRTNPDFVAALVEAHQIIREEGKSFQLKARFMSEELLQTTWKLIHSRNDDVAPNVKADLIKSMIRWGGLEPSKNAENVNLNNNALTIQIDLGGAQEPTRVING